MTQNRNAIRTGDITGFDDAEITDIDDSQEDNEHKDINNDNKRKRL